MPTHSISGSSTGHQGRSASKLSRNRRAGTSCGIANAWATSEPLSVASSSGGSGSGFVISLRSAIAFSLHGRHCHAAAAAAHVFEHHEQDRDQHNRERDDLEIFLDEWHIAEQVAKKCKDCHPGDAADQVEGDKAAVV